MEESFPYLENAFCRFDTRVLSPQVTHGLSVRCCLTFVTGRNASVALSRVEYRASHLARAVGRLIIDDQSKVQAHLPKSRHLLSLRSCLYTAGTFSRLAERSPGTGSTSTV